MPGHGNDDPHMSHGHHDMRTVTIVIMAVTLVMGTI